jgi:gliding motility-associated-like protein
MVLTIRKQATAYAGMDAAICQGSTYTLSTAVATNAISILWTTSGTGSFNSATSQNPVYTPSQNDIDDGSVILTMTATSASPCTTVSDAMTLIISHQAVVNAGSDVTICQGTAYTVSGATALYAVSVLWTHNGTGTLTNAATLTPTYTPSAGETGAVTLTLTAVSQSPCPVASDQMIINITPAATVSAGTDATICESGTYTLNGSMATNAISMLWTTSGSGSFSNATLLHPVYIPSASDILNGSVVLTLTVTPGAPCTAVSDAMTLTIKRQAVVNAGSDATICQGSAFTVSTATALYAVSIQWTHNGTGTLSNVTTLTPTYTPGANETGLVTLTLTAFTSGPCVNASDQMVISITPATTVLAGTDATICESGTYTLSSSSSTNSVSLLWTTSGTGSFSDASALHPVYTPSAADILNGTVILTLTGTATSPCPSVSDAMVLTISRQTFANAGTDATICEGLSYTVTSATASYAASILWTHNGLGVLTGSTTLSPTYTPVSGESGTVTLTLTANAVSPCTGITDQMVITINPAVIATAGPDLSSCAKSAVPIPNASVQNSASVLWTTNGTGTFDNPGAVNPVYTPGAGDLNIGMVVLTMHVTGIAPCSNVTDDLILTLIPSPLANAGSDASTCQGVPYVFTDASASNFATLAWVSTPSNAGTLLNATTITPTFVPAAGFVGTVSLTLTAVGNTACSNVTVTDQMLLTVNSGVVVDAGADQIIPVGTPTMLYASATAGSGVYVWSWEPSQLLVTNNSANPTTVPLFEQTQFIASVLDIITGCSSSDSMFVSMSSVINHPPVAIDDRDTMLFNTQRLLSVAINDSDPDGDQISISLCGNPAHGYLDLHSNNRITYTPDMDYIGDDSFYYVICDDGAPSMCDTAIVYIHIKKPTMDDLKIYNLLTPNGDGSNESWVIRGIEEYPENTIIIFNRWGDKIREFKSYDNKNIFWDGTSNENRVLPGGTYFYILEVKNVGSRTGWIYLHTAKEE